MSREKDFDKSAGHGCILAKIAYLCKMNEMEPDYRGQARRYRLGLQLEPGQLRVLITPVDGEAGLHQFSIPLDPTADPAKALEDAIYATPMLLGDYASIGITVVTDNFIPTPAGLAEAGAEVCDLVDEDFGQMLVKDTITGDIQVAWAFDRKLFNFLERTFRNCPIRCSVTPLTRFLHAKAVRGNTGKVFVHFHGHNPRRADIAAFGADGRLLMLTTKPCRSEADAAYFVLATIDSTGLSRTDDEVQICGDAAARDAILPILRRYVRFAVPLIFPSEAFRMGREALVAPFPLIVQTLCE